MFLKDARWPEAGVRKKSKIPIHSRLAGEVCQYEGYSAFFTALRIGGKTKIDVSA